MSVQITHSMTLITELLREKKNKNNINLKNICVNRVHVW